MEEIVFETCQECGGDPRASRKCKTCHGAGVTVRSPDGPLIWGADVSAAFFGVRAFRRRANAILNLLLGVSAFALIGWFMAWLLLDAEALPVLQSVSGWFAGHPAVSALWMGVLLACFCLFRIRVYTERVRSIPTWGKTEKQIATWESGAASRPALDVSAFYQESAWTVLQNALHLAERTERIEVTPVHIFSAALASTAGGVFLTRLGLAFTSIQDRLAALVRDGQSGAPPLLALASKRVLLAAYLRARQARRRAVGSIDLFLESYEADERLQDLLDRAGVPPKHVRHVAEWIRVQETLKEEHDRFVQLAALKPASVMNRSMTARQTPILDRFSEDLTQLARRGYLAPLVGRDREMAELLRGIESGRRSVVLIGETGVGKNALVEGLARRMVEEDVPPELFDRRLVSVSAAQLLASGDPSLASQRLLALLQDVALAGNVILVIEGIEALAGAGIGGPMDVAEALSSELDKGYFIMIATTTPQAWTEYLERRSLAAKLIKVNVPELSEDDAIRVLMARSGSVEYQNNVFFSYGAVEKAATLAGRYLRDLALPESAFGILKEAAVLVRREHGEQAIVGAEDVARIIQEKTNIPVEAVTQTETDKLLNLEDRLHRRVIGQNEAVTAVAQAMRRARAEVREGKRPIANFLFLGPTGVGKTELAKALAAEYFGNEQMMVRLDMSEYQNPSAVSRMIGAPGDERGGLLTEAVRKNPFTIVLLDELEKAHPDILTLFLQVMDDGRLTDGVGRTVDFTNVVLIATSNAGTSYIQDQVKAGTSIERIKTGLIETELKGLFRPEFLNRFDAIIVFRPLELGDVLQIAWLMLNGITKRLDEKGIGFRAEDEAVEELARAGYDPIYGARPLRRVIQDRIENQLADLLLRGTVARKDTIVLDADGTLRVEKRP